MASTAASVSPASADASCDVSLVRMYVLRATYLLLIVGLGVFNLPELVDHAPTSRGVIPGVLAGVWLLAFVGLKYPLQMLPLLFFELAWKTIWMLDFGLPQWSSGQMPATWSDDFQAIAAGLILLPLVIPWGYVWRNYVTKAGPRWSKAGRDAAGDNGVSVARLYVIRGTYMLFFIPGTVIVWRALVTTDPMNRGVFASMLGALFVLSFLVIRYPLQMLPVLLLEFVWKLVWLAFFGIPQWMTGIGSPQFGEDIWAVGAGPILFGLLIPWNYVWRHYVRAPAERWR